MGRMYDALQKVERVKTEEHSSGRSSILNRGDFVLDSKLVSYFEPSSLATEQFKKLRAHIFKPGSENTFRTILVSSALAGEGKSLVAINLAITIAIELHSNALLVDCDLRNPCMSRWFGIHNQSGLSNYLLGESELGDLLLKTSIDKLTILPGGTAQDNPVELIGSNKMKSLVKDLRSRYPDRYVIFDSSPLLATTEPSVLQEITDGVLLVIKSADTQRESVEQAIKMINRNKIIGVVLNKQEFKTEALIRRYFGTNRYYAEYQYSEAYTAKGGWKPLQNVRKYFFSPSHKNQS